jgi:peptidoglycan/xylan/chitin deacetylase (PgdA/CDA1 family)
MPRETSIEYWNVPPAQFDREMHYLYSHGYNIITVGEAYRLIRSGQPLPAKAVSITFDDGYRNNYEFAYPILCKYGLRVTMFLVYEYVGSRRAFEWVHWDDAALRDKETNPSSWEPLTWDQVIEMSRHGIEFESHSLTHSRLSDLSPIQLSNELEQSKDKLEQRLGTEVIGFVSPFGLGSAFKKTVREILIEKGYRYAFLGRIGSIGAGDDSYDWGRHSVYEKDSLEIFKRKLDGAYDWLGWVQPIWQRLLGT